MKLSKFTIFLILSLFSLIFLSSPGALSKKNSSLEAHQAGKNGKLPNSSDNLSLLLKFTTALGGLVGLKTRDQIENDKKAELEHEDEIPSPIDDLEASITNELAQESKKLEKTNNSRSPASIPKKSK